jgi:hypothetical protein
MTGSGLWVTKEALAAALEKSGLSYEQPVRNDTELVWTELVNLTSSDEPAQRAEGLREALLAADDFLTRGSRFNGFAGPDPIAAHIALEEGLRGVAPRVATEVPTIDPAVLCECGHRHDHHTNRDVDDVVGWPCLDCHSARCRGFRAALAAAPPQDARWPSPEQLAQMFHENYERLAPSYHYATRPASAVPWDGVPAANKALMIATADAVLAALQSKSPSQR